MKKVMPVALDLALVVVFILISRVSHERSLAAERIWHDVWPFLAGVVLGWVVTRAWRDPLTLGSAFGVWACAMAVGFLPRFTVPPLPRPADMLVAGLVLGFLFSGWRLYAFLVRELRRRRAAGLPVD